MCAQHLPRSKHVNQIHPVPGLAKCIWWRLDTKCSTLERATNANKRQSALSDMAKNLILWLVIAVVLMTVFNNFSQNGAANQQVAYSQFINQVHNGGVRAVDIDGRVITAQSRSGEQFTTVIPTQYDPKLLDDLIENNVVVRGKLPEEPSILAQIFISWFPMLLLIGVWIFFMRQMQGD